MQPIYEQIISQIKANIMNGELKEEIEQLWNQQNENSNGRVNMNIYITRLNGMGGTMQDMQSMAASTSLY